MSVTIIDAIRDRDLFRPFLEDKDESISSWLNWLAALRVVYGLPVPQVRREMVEQCTGRSIANLPKSGFQTALFLTGRRCGKSRSAALIASFEAAMAGHEGKLAKGEKGIVVVVSPTRRQSHIVKDYIRAVFNTDVLRGEIADETNDGFKLANGVTIEILAGDYRTVRGFTLLAAVVDEAAFFGYDAECKIKSDSELIRAIKPGLTTTGGKLVAISTPYARKGWTFKTFEKNFANDSGKILVWNCPSRVMNPTLPQSVVDDALAEDLHAAKSEFLGEFRDDVASFLSRELIECLVVKHRRELRPMKGVFYVAFADLSGGRKDDAALCIAHAEEKVVVVDYLRRWRSPFNPHLVVIDMANEVKRFGIWQVTGDNYAAEFVARAFESEGLEYAKSEKPKNQLYGELLPRICSHEIELPDDVAMVDQFASLERRTRSGGRDIIDHPPGGHDDLANVVAGVADVAVVQEIVLGAL